MTLNYNHLRYFWAVAKEGHLTRAAEQLNISQSALSAQIKTLEERIGHRLFERQGRRLVLSAAGQVAMSYCETIFQTGDALVRRLSTDRLEDEHPLRVGALSTLSRNFQLGFLRPILVDKSIPVALRSGTISELLTALDAHLLDLVLVNQVPFRDATTTWTARVIDEQPVAIVGTPERLAGRGSYAELLASEPLILPTRDSGFRNGIDLLASGLDTPMQIAAEVDDMAMMRLLARADVGLAILPTVVVRDELANGTLIEACVLPNVVERFSVLIPEHQFLHPAIRRLLPID